jgi:hypothetical protein
MKKKETFLMYSREKNDGKWCHGQSRQWWSCGHGSIDNPIEFTVSSTQEQEIKAGKILNSFLFLFFKS